MKKDIRLFLTDLDGTLLKDDHLTVSARSREVLLALKAQGVPLCACTGRVRCVLPPAVAEIGFDYAITSNGASCVDLRTGERIFSAYMPAERAELAWKLLAPTNCITEWYVDGDILMDRHNHSQWQERLKARWHREYLGQGKGIVVEDIREYLDRGAPMLEKISIFDCPENVRTAAIEPMLATGHFEISTSLGINFEITDISADKGLALKSLAAHLGIGEAQTLAFGDAGNDLPLLRAAGLSVAMGNALDEVKAAANAVTDTNEDDGVAAYLEREVL